MSGPEWTYVAEYYSMKNKPTKLRAVYRSRTHPSGAPEDYIFSKGGWKPTSNLIGIRMGYGEHETFDIPEDEAEKLTGDMRRGALEALRKGVADVVEILRSEGLSERAAEIAALYESISGGPHIEEQLHDLVSHTGFPGTLVDEDTIIRYNQARRAVVSTTQASQR